ncbi:hypothetical protein Tco_1166302, partial [Tanacetum coccineum]
MTRQNRNPPPPPAATPPPPVAGPPPSVAAPHTIHRSVFPEKLMLPPLQSRWETSQPPPLSAGIIVTDAAELLVLPEYV